MMPTLHSILFGAVGAALLTGFVALIRDLATHRAELRALKERVDQTAAQAQAEALPARMRGLEGRCFAIHGTGPVPILPQVPGLPVPTGGKTS